MVMFNPRRLRMQFYRHIPIFVSFASSIYGGWREGGGLCVAVSVGSAISNVANECVCVCLLNLAEGGRGGALGHTRQCMLWLSAQVFAWN